MNNRTLMKKFKCATILILLLLFSIACSTAEDESYDDESPVEESNLWVSHNYETHFFLSERINIHTSPGELLQGSVFNADTFYYYYTATRSFSGNDIVVVSNNIDTGDSSRILLPFNDPVEITGLNITEDGKIMIFAIEFINDEDENENEDDLTIIAFYAEYDLDGNQISKKDFNDLFDYDASSISIQQAIFVDDTHIVLSVYHREPRGYSSSIHILDLETGDTSVLYSNSLLFQGTMTTLNDKRIVISEVITPNQTSIREINIEEGTWGDVLATVDIDVIMIFSAVFGSPFDLLIVEEKFLYGYDFEQKELVALLSWEESDIHRVWGLRFGFFEDGRVNVFITYWNDDDEQELELYLLTPAKREIVEGRIILTLGGANIDTEMKQAVAKFNRSNSLYEIVIDEYNPSGDLMEGTWDASSRLQIELMTGKGPDIVYNVWEEVADRGLLLDLHPFLHADSELSHDDFIPSFLSALESPDGALYMLVTDFHINTFVGKSKNLENIELWTPDAFLELMQNNRHLEYPMGAWMARDNFIWILLSGSYNDFVNFETYEADFDNESFIDILEMSKYFITEFDEQLWGSLPYDILRVSYGDQLLMLDSISHVGAIESMALVIPDYFVIGLPTKTGGVHHVRSLGTPFGINAATNHPDAAWEFLRQFLFPFDDIIRLVTTLPLRKDMLEKAFEDSMTPQYGTDKDGNRVVVPKGTSTFPCGTVITHTYLKEEDADTLRQIIETAQPGSTDKFSSLWFHIIADSLDSFFAGARTAEETARIIQNRAQTYLHEQR